jgi:papain like cysteine protease AvrRpt2/putative peptidoglycan binding protein
MIVARDETFDIWHEVPLVPQLTGMSCWAAAAAMIIGWRDCLDVNPEEVARASGRWSDYRDGMHPLDIDAFAGTWGLHVEPAGSLTVARLRELLDRNGPLWVGEASAGLHVIVVAGIHGDGTPGGTFVRVLDPWPEGRGERYALTAAELLESLRATVEMSGLEPRILHAGGRGCGTSRSAYRVHEERHSFVRVNRPAPAEGHGQARYGTPRGVLRRYAPARDRALAQRATDEDVRGSGVIDDTDWYTDQELSGEPSAQGLLTRADAAWADDATSPDYGHLNHAGSSIEFDLTGVSLRELFSLNGFEIDGDTDEVLFGLRGCGIRDEPAGGRFAKAVTLVEDLPDHVGYHCVLGVYRRSTGEIAVFPGSTVPNWALMEKQRAAGATAQIANLLPTGCYDYHVGAHRAVTGAFVLQPDVLVLRTRDNLVFDVRDGWERHTPADNIHPGFTGQQALFSSAGCQTIPGRWTQDRGHEGLWASFRIAAGLSADNRSGWGRQFHYCLLTGRDARLMRDVARPRELARLRFGSRGAAVQALQDALSKGSWFTGSIGGRFDAETALAFVRWQQNRNGTADAIVTPAIADSLGLDALGS